MKAPVAIALVCAAELLVAVGCARDDADAAAEDSLLGCVGPDCPNIDVRRSLVVTDVAILDERFSFERVMNTLAAQSGVAGLTGLDLYQQWWDTQNDSTHAVSNGEHCDDTVNPEGHAIINGYPINCPRQEGALAATVPFPSSLGPTVPVPTPLDAGDTYFPIALFNRFDLAPADGTHCGEYRIVFGKRSTLGVLGFLDRNLIIFEARMPNPNETLGLEGCRPLVDAWVELSGLANRQVRAARLEAIYFDGVAGFPPVIDIDHFAPNTGQIRSNQFMFLRDYFGEGAKLQFWQLREYRLVRNCSEQGCTSLAFDQVTDKGNPFAPLFNDRSPVATGPEFRTHFLTQVESLAVNDLNGFSMGVPEVFNSAESTEQGNSGNDVFHFKAGSGAFAAQIQAELARLNIGLQPIHIVRRAMATSCAGCHELNRTESNSDLGGGLVWPQSLVFTHVSEQQTVACAPFSLAQCWQISPALQNVFLPHRKAVLEAYLGGAPMQSIASRVH